MSVDVEILGTEKMEIVARALKEVGDKTLRKELYTGIQRAAKPMKESAKRAALADLPKRGGLNQTVAKAKFSVKTRGGRNPSVRLEARSAGHDLKAMDRGRLRHPVFGNKRAWVNQQIKPGWFSDAMRAEAPVVRLELIRVLDQIAEELARRG